MVFTTEELFEVAIESWPEWDLNRLSYQAMSSTHTLFYIYIYIYTEQSFLETDTQMNLYYKFVPY